MSNTAYISYANIQIGGSPSAGFITVSSVVYDGDDNVIGGTSFTMTVPNGVKREDFEASVVTAVETGSDPDVSIDKAFLLPEFRKIK